MFAPACATSGRAPLAMSSLSGLPVPVVAAGAAALGAGAATAFHRSSRGGSRRRRTPRAVILVEEPAPRASHRARDRALALDASSASTAASAAFPLASRASARGILFDADGEPVAIPPRDGFGPGALLVTGAVCAAPFRARCAWPLPLIVALVAFGACVRG